MPVYKRGGVWHYDFTVRGERFRGSTGARSKDAALVIEGRAHKAAILGCVHQSLTLEDAADLWFSARKAGGKSAKDTAQRIEIMLRHMGRATPVSEIGPRQITAAIQARRLEPVRRGQNRRAIDAFPTNGTVNRDLIDTTLRPILNYARRNLEAPVKDIPWAELRLSEPRERVRWFSDDEIAAWSGALPYWHRPLLRFILRYGVRLTEAFFPLDAMRGDDIYTRDRKNGPQVVTLLPEDAADLRARAGRARAAGLDTVWFREMRSGKLVAIKPRGFQSASAAALAKAGIAARAVHDGRHHAGTMLLRQTGNLAVVKELLGHEAIASTMRYAHTSRDDLRRALRHAYATPPETPVESVSEIKDKAAG